MDDETPGFVARKLPKKIIDVKDVIKNETYLHLVIYILKKTRAIANIYVDLLKDILLVITIVSALGGLNVVFEDITAFPSVVRTYHFLSNKINY